MTEGRRIAMKTAATHKATHLEKLRTCVAAATRKLLESYAEILTKNGIEQEKLRSYAKQANSF